MKFATWPPPLSFSCNFMERFLALGMKQTGSGGSMMRPAGTGSISLAVAMEEYSFN